MGRRLARWLLCLLLLVVHAQAWAQIELNGGTATAGPGEQVFIPVDLVTDGSVVALQFDLAFDATVLGISGESGGTALADHSLDTQLVAPGLYRVVVTTTTVEPLLAGRLITLDVDIAPGSAPGDYPMGIAAVVLADANGGAIVTGSTSDALVRVARPPAAPPPGAASPPTPVPVLGLWGTLFLAAALAALAWLFLRRGMTGVLQSLAVATVLLGSVVRAALIPGDANGDGQVDAADIPVIVAQILERETAPGDPDCNQDTLVNVLDTICTPDVPPVNQPPVLQAISDVSVLVDTPFALTATATDPDLPNDSLAWALDMAPAGMVIGDLDGAIGWTPQAAQLGAHPVVVRVTDGQGAFDTEGFTITVTTLQENAPPTLQAIPDQEVHDGEIVALQALADDPDLPHDELRWELRGGPQGVSLSRSDGSFLWVPTAAQLGANAFTLRVTDAQGAFDEKSFTVNVRSLGGPPSLADVADQSLVVDESLSLALQATDPDLPDDTLAFSLLTAPADMGIDSATGALEWTPSQEQVGLHDVTAQVMDREGLRDITSFIVTVRPVNGAPLAVDDSYPVRITETLVEPAPGVLGNDSDPDGDGLTAEWVSGPEKGSLVFAADGSFEYTPTPPDPEVQLELQCEAARNVRTEQTNGTVAVADVDGDGTIELVGVNYIRSALRPEFWVLNAEDCSNQLDRVQNLDVTGSFDISGHLGLLDIDGDGLMEIIGVQGRFPLAREGRFDGHHLLAVRLDGSPAWGEDGVSETVPELPDSEAGIASGTYFARGPTFADLDGDGVVEIVMRWHRLMPPGNFYSQDGITVYDSRDGSIVWTYVGQPSHGDKDNKPPVVADLDLDGTLEIIVHDQVVDHLGSLEYEFEVADTPFGAPEVTYSLQVAIANFDDDAYPEVVAYDAYNRYLFEHDGSLVWQIPMANGARSQITVADLDGDGEMEYAFVFGNGNAVGYLQAYDTDGSVLWSHGGLPDLDIPAIFWNEGINLTGWDANRDGAVDLVLLMDRGNPGINANTGVLVVDGRDGAILESLPFNQYFSGQSYVGVADVDGDGHGELIASFTSGGPGSTAVWRGAESHPTPPAPPIRNQWIYQYTHVAADGSIPARPRPHWLTPGLNGFNFVPVRLDGAPPETDAFTYRARDGALASNEATVTLELLPPGDYAPEFASSPRQFGTRGFAYEYLPLVVDRDFGDTFAFVLTAGPPGMTIDPVLGRVRWEDPDLGVYGVGIAVTDSTGKSAFQQYELEIVEPVTVPDLFGLTGSAADTALDDALLQAGRVSSKHHASAPVGTVFMQSPIAGSLAEADSRVAYTLSLGPGPEDTDGDGDGYTPNEGDCDDTNGAIHPDAADADGNGVDEDCDGIDGTQPVTSITVDPGELFLLEGEVVALQAWAGFDDGTAQRVTTVVDWNSDADSIATVSSTGVVQAMGPGTATISATRDSIVGIANVTVAAANPGDVDAPLVQITSPGDGETVFGPVEVTGTASDANLVRWELEITPVGEDAWVEIGAGTTPVVGGVIGQLDPTMMLNGQFMLRLSVLDAGGSVTEDEVEVLLDGGMKVGSFSLAYEDLNVSASGFPLRVTRTYDSRDQRPGAFGVGWRLGVETMEIACSLDFSDGWYVAKSGLSYGLVQTRPHSCSVQMPGRRAEVFDLEVQPATSAIVPFSFLTARFRARPGTVGSLTVPGGIFLAIVDPQPGHVVLLNDNLEDIDLAHLRYTSPAGVVAEFTGFSLSRLTDANGNSLAVGPDGLVHSSGLGIDFQRDSQNRVMQITDPSGNQQSYHYDGEGNLVRHVDPMGVETRYRYDAHHRLVDFVDPARRPVRHEYDAEGRLITIIDADGHSLTFDHDLASRVETRTDREGGQVVYQYDEQGNMLSVTDAAGHRSSFTYDEHGRRLSQTNALSETTLFAYDVMGNLVSLTNALGGAHHFEYDANGRLLRETDADGDSKSYEYDQRGNLVRETDAAGHEVRFANDDSGNVIQQIDAVGRTTTIERNGQGQVIAIRNPGGLEESFSLDASGNVTVDRHLLDTGAGVISVERSYQRDARGLVTSVQTPESTQPFLFGWNEAGELSSSTDPLGNRVSIERDILGRVIERDDGITPPVSVIYDREGREVEMLLPGGDAVRQDRDIRGDATSVDLPGLDIIENSYDPLRRVVSNGAPGYGDVGIDFDAAGRMTQRNLPGGGSFQYEYDADGHLVRQVDPLGNATTLSRDARGLVTNVKTPDGFDHAMSHTEEGRISGWVDELGVAWSYQYDDHALVSAVVDATGGTARYHRLDNGALAMVVSPGGRTWRYASDAGGRITVATRPDGSTGTCDWDALDRPVSCTDFNGVTATFTYDDLAGTEIVERPEGVTTGTIDVNGNLSEMSTPLGVYEMTSDVLGRLGFWTSPLGMALEIEYAGGFNPISITLHNGDTQEFTYGQRGELLSINDGTGQFHFDHDAALRPLEITFPGGARFERELDAMGRVTELAYENGATVNLGPVSYDYDPQGRLVTSSADGIETQFSYDELGRLESTRSGATSIEYAWDEDSNLISRTENGVTRTFEMDVNGALIGDGVSSFEWDANGNLVAIHAPSWVASLDYDSLNRLVEFTRTGANPVAIQYGYAYDGLLETRTRNGVTEYFTWNRNGDLPTLVGLGSSSSAIDRRFIYQGMQAIAEVDAAGNLLHHVRDRLGSLLAVVAPDGAIVDTVRYDPFGLQQQGAPSPVGFIGGYTDVDTGLLFLRARWYQPENARFITRDTEPFNIYDTRSLNRYVYAFGDPVNRLDLTGKSPDFAQVLTGLAIANMLAVSIYSLIVDGTHAVTSGLGLGSVIFGGYFLGNETGRFAPLQKLFSAGPFNVGISAFPSVGIGAGPWSLGVGIEAVKWHSGIRSAYVHIGSGLSGKPRMPGDMKYEPVTMSGSAFGLGAYSSISHTPQPFDYEGPFISVAASLGLKNWSGTVLKKVNYTVPSGLGGQLFWSPTTTYTDSSGKHFHSHGIRGGLGGNNGAKLGINFSWYLHLVSTDYGVNYGPPTR